MTNYLWHFAKRMNTVFIDFRKSDSARSPKHRSSGHSCGTQVKQIVNTNKGDEIVSSIIVLERESSRKGSFCAGGCAKLICGILVQLTNILISSYMSLVYSPVLYSVYMYTTFHCITDPLIRKLPYYCTGSVNPCLSPRIGSSVS